MTAREVRCELTEQVNYVQDDGTTRYGCEHCRRNAPGAPPVPRADEPDVGPTIAAGFPGKCWECGTDIDVGDAICPVDGEWIHVECVS